MKIPFISRERLAELTEQFPTPFHLYDEKGIRARVRALHQAFAWNPGFKEYFAVKATPNPANPQGGRLRGGLCQLCRADDEPKVGLCR